VLKSLRQIGAWRSLVARLLWEQEVPSSNLGAPTNNSKHLERVLVEPVLFCLFSRRWDRRYSLNFITLILLKIRQIIGLVAGSRFDLPRL
jgi:hypothetical protein